MAKPLIVIVGPTASGKTRFSIFLAKLINAEIISADSLQVYKYMDIGTSKPNGTWLTVKSKRFFMVDNVPHHMVDIIKPDEEFNVGKYRTRVTNIIKQIYNRKKIPLLVGGGGLYIKAIVDGLCSAPPSNWGLRRKLREDAVKRGIEYLYNRLKKIDPKSASQIHKNNLQRIIRALEVYQITGIPFSKIQQITMTPDYKTVMIGLHRSRNILYERINQRVEWMFQKGLVQEVQNLLNKGYTKTFPSMQGLGYKQVIDYLEGKADLKETIYLIKRDTRRYAKGQLTWFNKDKRIHWIKLNENIDTQTIIHKIHSLIKNSI